MQGEFPKKFTALVVARSLIVPLTEGKVPDSRATSATKQRLLCSDYPCACSHKSQLVFITRSGKFTCSFVAVKYNLLWCNQYWMLCSAHFVHIPIDLGLFSYSLMLLNNIHTCLVKDCSVLLLALVSTFLVWGVACSCYRDHLQPSEKLWTYIICFSCMQKKISQNINPL